MLCSPCKGLLFDVGSDIYKGIYDTSCRCRCLSQLWTGISRWKCFARPVKDSFNYCQLIERESSCHMKNLQWMLCCYDFRCFDAVWVLLQFINKCTFCGAINPKILSVEQKMINMLVLAFLLLYLLQDGKNSSTNCLSHLYQHQL